MINVVKALGFCSTSSLIRLLLCIVWVGGQGVSMCISGVYVLRLLAYVFYCVLCGEGIRVCLCVYQVFMFYVFSHMSFTVYGVGRGQGVWIFILLYDYSMSFTV